jgi:hypothetical protein
MQLANRLVTSFALTLFANAFPAHICPGPRSRSQQEKRNYMFGRIFSWLVLCRSHRVDSLSSSFIADGVKTILAFAEQKKPLRELCFEAVGHIVEQVGQ